MFKFNDKEYTENDYMFAYKKNMRIVSVISFKDFRMQEMSIERVWSLYKNGAKFTDLSFADHDSYSVRLQDWDSMIKHSFDGNLYEDNTILIMRSSFNYHGKSKIFLDTKDLIVSSNGETAYSKSNVWYEGLFFELVAGNTVRAVYINSDNDLVFCLDDDGDFSVIFSMDGNSYTVGEGMPRFKSGQGKQMSRAQFMSRLLLD